MNVVIQNSVQAAPEISTARYDYEKILSLALIRQHTKTDDVPAVTDEQLELYRSAAFEAAETYTGLFVTDRRVITEQVKLPKPPMPSMWGRETRGGDYFYHDLQHPTADEIVYYRAVSDASAMQLRVPLRSTRVKLPATHYTFQMNECCNPCGSSTPHGMIMYTAGYGCEADIPRAMIIGCLKYIAFSLENIGDLPVPFTTFTEHRSAPHDANPAIASGAVEIWRSLIPGAI